MKVIFFALTVLLFIGCSGEKHEAVQSVPDESISEKRTEIGTAPLPAPVEKVAPAQDETPDIAEDLQKLKKVPDKEKDNDCIAYIDKDGDGFGTDDDTVKFDCSGSVPVGYAKEKGDCNDNNKYVYHKAEEICNGFDDNCDGVIDPENSKDCNRYYKDVDEDGYGTDESKCLCVSMGNFTTFETGDCDDNNKKVHPGLKEVCNGIDDNCNSEIDEGEDVKDCKPFYIDNDGDGFGYGNKSECLCKPKGIYKTEKTGDCNDNNPSVYPGARELFDGIDNNCNGVVDEIPGVMIPPDRHYRQQHQDDHRNNKDYNHDNHKHNDHKKHKEESDQ